MYNGIVIKTRKYFYISREFMRKNKERRLRKYLFKRSKEQKGTGSIMLNFITKTESRCNPAYGANSTHKTAGGIVRMHMQKRILSALLAIVMMIGIIPFIPVLEVSAATFTLDASKYHRPISNSYSITGAFNNSRSGRSHAAVDFGAPHGTPIYAIANGTVRYHASDNYYLGTTAFAVENDDGTWCVYAEIATRPAIGSRVSKGQQISTVKKNTSGSAMLHFEMYAGTSSGNPFNQKSNNTYDYVKPNYGGTFQRRRDLVNPTNIANAPFGNTSAPTYNIVTISPPQRYKTTTPSIWQSKPGYGNDANLSYGVSPIGEILTYNAYCVIGDDLFYRCCDYKGTGDAKDGFWRAGENKKNGDKYFEKVSALNITLSSDTISPGQTMSFNWNDIGAPEYRVVVKELAAGAKPAADPYSTSEGTSVCDKTVKSPQTFSASTTNKGNLNKVLESGKYYKVAVYAKWKTGEDECQIKYFKVTMTSANIADGYYSISSKLNNSKCVDIKGGYKDNGTTAILYDWQGSDNQIFYFERLSDGTYRIKAKHSGRYLEVRDSSHNNGAEVAQWEWHDGYSCKRWYIIDTGGGYYKLVNKESGKCLDVAGANTTNSTRIQQYEDNATDAQRFKLTKVG